VGDIVTDYSTSITIQLTNSFPEMTLVQKTTSSGSYEPEPPQTIAPGTTVTFRLSSDSESKGSVEYVNRQNAVTVTIVYACVETSNTGSVNLDEESVSTGVYAVDWFGQAENNQEWLPDAIPEFGSPMAIYAGLRMLTETPLEPPAGQIL
jgi:hypothetical protein